MSASDAQSKDTASQRSASPSSQISLIGRDQRSMSVSSDRSAGTAIEDATEETPMIQQPPANEPTRPPIAEPYQPHQRLETFPLSIQYLRQGSTVQSDEQAQAGPAEQSDSDADTVFTNCSGNTGITGITIPSLIGGNGQLNHNVPGNVPAESACDRCERLCYDNGEYGPDGEPAYLSESHACICESCPRRVHIHGHTIVSAGTVIGLVAGVSAFMCVASQCEQ